MRGVLTVDFGWISQTSFDFLKEFWKAVTKLRDTYMSKFSPQNQERLRKALDAFAEEVQAVADTHKKETE